MTFDVTRYGPKHKQTFKELQLKAEALKTEAPIYKYCTQNPLDK